MHMIFRLLLPNSDIFVERQPNCYIDRVKNGEELQRANEERNILQTIK